MVAAWQAAAARYPQVVSLDDPMAGVTLAPGAFGSNTMTGGYRLEVSQKLPYGGKRALRGDNALARASAARNDVEDTRLQLAESARGVYFDYYLAEKALDVNAKNLELLAKFKRNATTRFETGLAPQQDILQVDVEIGRERDRRLGLDEARKIAVARANVLMHRLPESPLPPPPKEMALDPSPPDVSELRSAALARRPDLQALSDRIAAERASLALADREFYPDFEVMAAYDAIWQEKDLRPQVGVRLNLPVRQSRRCAAVAEAKARLAEREAELRRLTDQVNLQVQEAYERVRRAEQSVRLYESEILAAAEKNVNAARTAYETGKVPFLTLIEAQRNVTALHDRHYEALADYFRRRAELERAAGGPLQAPQPLTPSQSKPAE